VPQTVVGRNNWLFAGSLRAGQRAAAVMSLIQSARMNGHDPYAYLRDVMARLPMQRAPARSASCCHIAGSQPDKAISKTRPRHAVKMGWPRAYVTPPTKAILCWVAPSPR